MTKRLSSGVSVLALAAVSFGFVTISQAVETKGPVTDDIGVVEIPEGDPIVIGGYWTLSGPDTALGLDQKRAVEVAFPGSPVEDASRFSLDLTEVVLTHLNAAGDRLVIESWHPGRGVRTVDRT